MKKPQHAPKLGVLSWLGSGGRSLAHYAYFERDADSVFERYKRPARTLCNAEVGPVAVREHVVMPNHDPEPCPRCLHIKPRDIA